MNDQNNQASAETESPRLYRIRWGVGRPGKLWTGDAPPEGALVWNVKRVLRSCKRCKKSTLQFRCSAIEIADECIRRQMESQATDLWIFSGGVGSLQEDLPLRLAFTNWSHRIGGYAIVAPAAVATTKFAEEPPMAPLDWAWAQVYRGETLRQWVLMPASESGQEEWAQAQVEAVPFTETLKSWCGYERCPPCREKIIF